MENATYPQARSGIEYAEFSLFCFGILTFIAGIVVSSGWATALGFFVTLFAGLAGLRPD